jgi:hypothetical protein
MVFVVALTPLAARLPVRVKTVALVAGVTILAVQTWRLHGWARRYSQPVAIETTIEHEVARQLEREFPGGRVYGVGSVRYWMSAFADIPQFGGGFGQGVGFYPWWVVDYGLHFTEGEADLLIDWLRAYGVDALYAGEEGSRESIKPYRDAEKFRDKLPEVWREGGDVLYRIPRRGGLAHVIPQSVLVGRPPLNVLDAEPMRAYVAGLEDEDAKKAKFRWLSPDHATISASPAPGEVISVQIAYHPRWKARAGGRELPVYSDALGLMAIEPVAPGETEIEIQYRIQRWIWGVFLLAWLAGLAVVVRLLPALTRNHRSARSIS